MTRKFPVHGWIGAALVGVIWPVNWALAGPFPATAYLFFPLWLGYCLVVDALTAKRSGTSLFTRSKLRYISLFLVSAPAWWLFEILNWRLQNWNYQGRELFSDLEYLGLSTLSFSTVLPAVLGTAELLRGTRWLQNLRPGPVLRPDAPTTRFFALLGLTSFLAMIAWPAAFFPFMWLSLFFIMEPINIWLGHRSLAERTQTGDWRPVVAVWLGTLICGFFWEMWNWHSYPNWIYTVPWADFWHIFEMPLLGYGGYLPFGMELFALFHLLAGLFGRKKTEYVTAGLF